MQFTFSGIIEPRCHCFRVLAVVACTSGCTLSVVRTSSQGAGTTEPNDAGDAQAPAPSCSHAGFSAPLQASFATNVVVSEAVGPDALYWSESCGDCAGSRGTLWRQPLSGGAPALIPFPSVVAGAASTPQNLATDGTSLWFFDGDGLLRAALDGSNPQLVLPHSSFPVQLPLSGVAFEGDDLYAVGAGANGEDTVLVSIPKNGGPARTLATVAHRSGPSKGAGLVVDASRVYWVDYEESPPYSAGIFATPKAGGGGAELVVPVAGGGSQSAVTLAAGSGDALYAVGQADQTLRLVHTSRLAEPPTTVATSAAAPLVIAGDDVYFTSALATPPSIQHLCGPGPGAALSTLGADDLPIMFAAAPDRLFVAGLTASIDPQAQAEGAVWTLAR